MRNYKLGTSANVTKNKVILIKMILFTIRMESSNFLTLLLSYGSKKFISGYHLRYKKNPPLMRWIYSVSARKLTEYFDRINAVSLTDIINHIDTLNYFPEYSMISIQVSSICSGMTNKKLRSSSVSTCMCH